MCKFKSGILMRNGDLITSPYTESHEDLIESNNIKDNGNEGFIRVEYSPKVGNPTDLESYELKVDESVTPDWFEGLRESTTRKFHQLIKSMIITEDRKIILGGQWIISGNAIIGQISHAVIECVSDSAVIKNDYRRRLK